MYSQYKATEHDWLGAIPSHWKWLYLSQVSAEQTIKNTGNTVTLVLSLSYGQIVRKRNIDFGLSPKNHETYQIVGHGNIILRLTDLQNDHKSLRTGLVRERGIITSAYVCLKPFENSAYLQYLLHSYDEQKFFYGLGGGVRQSIGYKDIRYIKVPFPPRDEQDQIVRFLDWKVSQINKLINAKRRQIALLQEQRRAVIDNAVTKGLNPYAPIKNSGIPWVGVMPSSWITTQIKNHFHIEKRIAGQEGFDVLSITQAGIKVKDISTNEGQMASSYTNYQIVNPGEFAMNHMDLLTGYVDISKHFGVTSPDYRVFILDDIDTCCPDFYLHLFQLCYARRVFYGFGRGASTKGRWRMPKTSFLNFDIPLPPKDEQVKIVTYIGSQCANIDRLISKLNTEMQLFTEYRTRLISDAVTGKHDVRGVAVPEYETVDDMPTDETEPPDDEKSEREDDE